MPITQGYIYMQYMAEMGPDILNGAEPFDLHPFTDAIFLPPPPKVTHTCLGHREWPILLAKILS